MDNNDLVRYIILLVVLAVILLVTLGTAPIHLWDESRLAANAWDMFHNRQFMVLHFNGEPDLWNTKPPMMIWLQVASIELFGYSEFSVRFPSAISAILTCLFLVLVFHKFTGKFWLGILAVVILLTIKAYNGDHVARTADFDALLILFSTLSAFSLFFYTETDRPRFILFFFLFTGLAMITKGAAALLPLPGLAAYLVWRGKTAAFLRNRTFWLGSVYIAGVVFAIYGLREMIEPGYIEAVFKNEIGGRYFEVNEGHGGGFFYYFGFIFREYWMYFLPLVYFTYQLKNQDLLVRLSSFSLVTALSFVLVISLARTKLWWYASPIYPFIAVAIAIAGYSFFHWLKQKNKIPEKPSAVSIAIALTILLAFPIAETAVRVLDPGRVLAGLKHYDMSYYLKGKLGAEREIDGYKILKADYQPHVDFYIRMHGVNGTEIQPAAPHELQPGDRVLYWEELFDSPLAEQFIVETDRVGEVRIAEITAERPVEVPD